MVFTQRKNWTVSAGLFGESVQSERGANDQGVFGGKANSLTLGVNWFATTIRFSANYIRTLDLNGGPLEPLKPDIVELRSQWAF